MIYFDHASTSFKKPEEVSMSIYQALVDGIGNPGRGANEISMSSARILQDGRNAICHIFSGLSPGQVIFKGSLTDALNTLMLGLLKKGDHVISSVMEHNSVLRPLESLKQENIIEYDLLPCDEHGKILIQEISKLERPNTKAVILSQVSNLTGSIQPIREIRDLLINKDIFIIIDTAQSAGYINVNYQDLNIDGLAFTGHKGLLGPPGIGGFILNERLNKAMIPVFTGGTGSDSLSLSQPDFLPDKFEAGTQNLVGILGLTKGIEYVENTCSLMEDPEYLSLVQFFMDNLSKLKNIKLQGTYHLNDRVPTYSLLFTNMNPSEAAFLLERNYSIITRSGYQCAPLAHRALGSMDTGSLRISFGHFTTKDDVRELLQALDDLNNEV